MLSKQFLKWIRIEFYDFLLQEQLLDPTSKESAAVRLAHGEAQLVHEIRDFLQRQGVRLDLLTPPDSASRGRRDKAESHSSATHRQVSGQVFLIKNLPVGTTEDDVATLLRRLTRKGAHSLDPPRRILVPPLGITAIVEYAIPQIARLAYKAIAYEPVRRLISPQLKSFFVKVKLQIVIF